MQQSDVVERMKFGGASTKAQDAKEFAQFLAAEQARWQRLADTAGIKVDPE